MGGEAAFRGRDQSRAARGGKAAGRRRFQRARAGVRPDLSQSGERLDSPHTADAARLLCLPRVELQVVRQRSRRAVHDARRQAVQLAGTHARRRRPHECLGPAVVPLQRAGSARKVVRRLRRRLAALVQRSGAVLRHRRRLRRDFRTSRERARTARRSFPSGDADELRRDAAPHASEEQARLDGDDRTRGQYHAAAERPRVPATTAGRASTAA